VLCPVCGSTEEALLRAQGPVGRPTGYTSRDPGVIAPPGGGAVGSGGVMGSIPAVSAVRCLPCFLFLECTCHCFGKKTHENINK